MKKNLSLVLLLALCVTGCETIETSSSSSVKKSDTSITNSESSSSTSSSIEESSSTDDSSSASESSSTAEVELTKVSTATALKRLSSSYYKDAISTDESLGLNSLHEVGIDKDKFENEVKYPVPTTNVTTYNASDYSIVPNGTNNAVNFENLLSSIKSNKDMKVIKFSSGDYNFSRTVNIVGQNNLYIVGENTNWQLNAWSTYLSIADSNNIHINGFNFDISVSPTIAGTIKSYSYDNGGNCDVTLSIYDEFDLSSELYSSWSYDGVRKYGSYMECSKDKISGKYTPDSSKNLFYNTPSTQSSYRGMKKITINAASNELTIKLGKDFAPWKLREPTVGDVVSLAFTMYDSEGFGVKNCQEFYMEHNNVYVTAGMGIRFLGGKKAYINHTNFAVKENSKRIMTCTADIIHSVCVEDDLKITNCILEGSHDDALNIKNYYCNIDSVTKSTKEITVSQTQNETPVKFNVGDSIDIMDLTTMGVVDTYKVVSVNKVGNNYTLTVDRRPSNVTDDYSVANTTVCTKLYLHNCLIRNKRNRGILLQTRNSEISNCTFSNVIMGAIQVLSVGDSFKEGILPNDIVLKNNKLLDCQGGYLSVFAYGTNLKSVVGSIKNVLIENNYFANSNSTSLYLRSTSNLQYKNNLIHYSSNVSNRTIYQIEYSKDCTLKDNVCYFEGTKNNITMYNIDSVSSNINKENNLTKGG